MKTVNGESKLTTKLVSIYNDGDTSLYGSGPMHLTQLPQSDTGPGTAGASGQSDNHGCVCVVMNGAREWLYGGTSVFSGLALCRKQRRLCIEG